MSTDKSFLNSELSQYLENNFSATSPFYENLINEANELGFPPIHISPAQAQFLRVLIKSIDAKRILEIGSLAGYSTFMMASALDMPDCKLIAVERNPEYADFIRRKSSQGGFDFFVEIVNRDASEFLHDYDPGYEFDLIFIDADKSAYSEYMQHSQRLLRKGGILAVDNVFAFGELFADNPERNSEEIDSIRKFNVELRDNPNFESTIVPLGDGIAIGVRK